MAGLLPILPPLSLPLLGDLLNPAPAQETSSTQAPAQTSVLVESSSEDADNVRASTTTTRVSPQATAETTPSVLSITTPTPAATPDRESIIEQITSQIDKVQTTLETVLSPVPTQPTFDAGTATISSVPSVTPESQTTSDGDFDPKSLILPVSISAGIIVGAVLIGSILVRQYRNSKWPFVRRNRFLQIDEDEADKARSAKWDPSRNDGMSRISRFVSARSY